MKITIKLIIVFFSIAVFLSCGDEKAELVGTWGVYSNFQEDFRYWAIRFRENAEIELVNDYFFKEKGKYEVWKGKIKITLFNGEEMAINILKREENLLTISGGAVYKKGEGRELMEIENYSLVGVNTGLFLDESHHFFAMHLYIGEDDDLVIRKMAGVIDIKSIPYAYFEPPQLYPSLIFIGKKVSLKEVNEIYIRLEPNFPNPLLFVLDKINGRGYSILTKPIEVWQEDIENYVTVNKQPPLPLQIMNSYNRLSDFLKEKPKIIRIKSNADFDSLSGFRERGTYLVLIDNTLDMADYIELMLEIRRIQDSTIIDIRTDIL